MRILLAALASICFLSPKAQTHLPVSSFNYPQWGTAASYIPLSDIGHSNQKWQLTKYAALSAGYGFSPGSSFVSAPIGLLLTRSFTTNIYAFGGISASPVLFSVNRMLLDPASNTAYPGRNFSNAYGLGLNSRVEMGLMYINDAKTFSISGSIGVEKGSYPVYPSTRPNTKRQ